MTNLKILCAVALTISACATGSDHIQRVPIKRFASLKIGMSAKAVNAVLGQHPTAIKKSKSGNDEEYHLYGDSGYVWYDGFDELEGFAVFADLEGPSNSKVVRIENLNGYFFKEPANKKKTYLSFEPYRELKSDEAEYVFREQKNNLIRFFESKGYSFVDNLKKAKTIIVVRFGVSNPNTTQEIVSSPVYNFRYIPPQKSVTNFQNSYGTNLGSATTTTGSPYGNFENEYAGQKTQTITKTEYSRSLEFVCLDKTSKQEDSIFWRVGVSSVGQNGNIRDIFPFLFFAASTGTEKALSVKEYIIAFYHTGVRELVGKPVPRLGEQ